MAICLIGAYSTALTTASLGGMESRWGYLTIIFPGMIYVIVYGALGAFGIWCISFSDDEHPVLSKIPIVYGLVNAVGTIREAFNENSGMDFFLANLVIAVDVGIIVWVVGPDAFSYGVS